MFNDICESASNHQIMNNGQSKHDSNDVKKNDLDNSPSIKKNMKKSEISSHYSINDMMEENCEVFTKKSKKSFVIKRSSSRKELTRRTINDHHKIETRLNSCKNIYEKVKQLLRYIFGKWQIGQFREIAFQISYKINANIDRLAKRYNDCLICWFCENWKSVAPYLVEYAYSCLKNGNDNENKCKIFNIICLIDNISKINNEDEFFTSTILKRMVGNSNYFNASSAIVSLDPKSTNIQQNKNFQPQPTYSNNLKNQNYELHSQHFQNNSNTEYQISNKPADDGNNQQLEPSTKATESCNNMNQKTIFNLPASFFDEFDFNISDDDD